MDNSKIQQLLNKYWDGLSSLEEEQFLKRFFSQENIPQEWHSDKLLFQYFQQEKEKQFSTDISELLVSNSKKATILTKRTRYWMQIAAAILLLVMVKWMAPFLTPEKNIASIWEEKEVTDSKQAYQDVKAALLLVSSELNKGAEKAAIQMTKMKDTNQKYIK